MVQWKMAPLETKSSSRPPFSTEPWLWEKGYQLFTSQERDGLKLFVRSLESHWRLFGENDTSSDEATRSESQIMKDYEELEYSMVDI